MLKREAQGALEQAVFDFNDRNVIIVEGARQVGKTTIIRNILENKPGVISLNLEEDRIVNYKINQTREFKDFETILVSEFGFNPQERQIIFIDEAQENERLGDYVRFMKEKWSSTKVILSGSSMTRLFREEQRIPVGRFSKFKISPFNFSEFLEALGKKHLADIIRGFNPESIISDFLHSELLSYVDKFLICGGLPEVVLTYTRNGNSERITRSVLLSQEDDFLRKSGISKQYLFMDALRGVVNHLGSSSHLSHISEKPNDSKIIIDLMKRWHLIIEIEQKGITGTTKFHPKRYIYDLGIAAMVKNMPFPQLSVLNSLNPALRTELGGLIENMICLELQSFNDFGEVSLSSWKKNSNEGAEVDFILRAKKVIPIECKAALKMNRNISSLLTYLELTDLKSGIVISAAPYEVSSHRGKKIINLPLYLAKPNVILSHF